MIYVLCIYLIVIGQSYSWIPCFRPEKEEKSKGGGKRKGVGIKNNEGKKVKKSPKEVQNNEITILLQVTYVQFITLIPNYVHFKSIFLVA